MLLALLLAAPSTILVSPFAAKGASADWAGIVAAEGILDVVVQANTDNFLTLKQLDAVIRRRDLRLDDPAVAAQAVEFGRALGATDVIVGEVEQAGDTYTLKARRVSVADGHVVAAGETSGAMSAYPAGVAKLGGELVGASGKPLSGDVKALAHAARCEVALARQSVGAHERMALPKDKLIDAQRECRAAAKLDPRLGLAHAGLSITLSAENKFDAARKEARLALKVPFVPLAVLAEAYAARRMKDLGAWRTILSNAVDDHPGFLHALGYLAEDRMEAHEDKEASELFDRYLARAPAQPWAMAGKAHMLARLKQYDEAIELSEKALSLNPGDPELLIETASRYIDAGRDPKAEPLLKQAMAATPPRPLAALRLGYLYIRGHKLKDAREALEKAVAMATREDEARTRGIAHADLARVAAKQNRYPDALSELEKARAEGNQKLPCDEPELARWKDRAELSKICIEAAAAAADQSTPDDVPVDL